jgi:hypothetical protein
MPATAPYSDVLNIGLLQRQLMIFQSGAALFLAGCIFLAADAVLQHLAPPPSIREPRHPTETKPPIAAERGHDQLTDAAAIAAGMARRDGGF